MAVGSTVATGLGLGEGLTLQPRKILGQNSRKKQRQNNKDNINSLRMELVNKGIIPFNFQITNLTTIICISCFSNIIELHKLIMPREFEAQEQVFNTL